MMIGKSILFALALVVLHVDAGKVCSFVPQNDCLDDWDCETYTYNGYLYTGDEKPLYLSTGKIRMFDYDCTSIEQCPMTPTAENEGMICEADAVWAQGIANAAYVDTDAISDLDLTMPDGTVSDLNNCEGLYDVYEVVCVDEEEDSATTELETTEAPEGESCDGLSQSTCATKSYCREMTKPSNGSFKKCKQKTCKHLVEDTCIESPHCFPKYRGDQTFKKCKKQKN